MPLYCSLVYDCIIVGSGPAGVSAAFGLIPSKKNILMLDVGNRPDRIAETVVYEPHPDEDEQQTPKLAAPNLAYVFKDFKKNYNIRASDFKANGSLALGGLSNAWSCLSAVFSEEEFAKFPFQRSELIPYYQKTAERIGLSGSKESDLFDWLIGCDLKLQPNLNLHPLSAHLLSRYEKNKMEIQKFGFQMGRHNQAILTQPHDERKPFDYEAARHFTYSSDAVYNSALETAELKRKNNFSLECGLFVDFIERGDDVLTVYARDKNGAYQKFFSRKVILAAGTIGSTKILLKSLKKYRQTLPILNTLLIPFAMLVPSWILKPKRDFGFTFWNLSYYLQMEEVENTRVYGHLMTTCGVEKTEFLKRLPLTTSSSLTVANYLWPSLLLATCAFPSDFSQNRISLDEKNGLCLQGNVDENFSALSKKARCLLSKSFAKMGAMLLKNSWQVTQPGSDLHYAGTLPMSAEKKPLHTSPDGESFDMPGVHIADGSVLPYLPAKSHTFTIMANALRIGEMVGKR